jgi:hypothetical protein
MPTVDYLDEERVKLWGKVQELEDLIKNQKKELSESHLSYKSEIEKKLTATNQEVAAVKDIANAKTPENVQTTMTAAQTAVQKKNEIEKLLNDTQEAKTKLAETQEALKKITAIRDNTKQSEMEIDGAKKSILEAQNLSESNAKLIAENLAKAQKAESEAQAKWTTVNQQAQNIAELKAQALTDAASVKVVKENAELTQKELKILKESLEKEKDDWIAQFTKLEKDSNDKIGEMLISKEKALSSLHNENAKDLKKLHDDFSQKHTALAMKIEELLPGATSVALATAFADRKNAIEKNKRWWAITLIASALLIILFGLFSLYYNSSLGSVASIPARMIVIGGLIIVEEFARRNYNIISRLAESYAYKEALAKSYLGYKKEMAEIPMPGPAATTSVSVLVKTFLDKLEDEPGKHVFDKEKPVLGPQAIIDNCNPNSAESTVGKAAKELSKGIILTKISWPVVAIIAILAIAGCIIAHLTKGQWSL